jgi:PAS domain S-box-containing protein
MSLLAYEAVEKAAFERLMAEARAVEGPDLDRVRGIAALRDRLGDESVLSAVRMDARGRVTWRAGEAGFDPVETFGVDSLTALASGRATFLAAWTGDPAGEGAPGLAAAVRLGRGKGLAAVEADASWLFALRREAGPGRLVQEIADQPGVAYVALQDAQGIRLASRGVTRMSAVDADPFLALRLRRPEPAWRTVRAGGREVFEFAGAFFSPGEAPAVLRVGLDTAAFRSLTAAVRWRILLSSAALLLAGLAGLSLVFAGRSLRTVGEAYRRERTHTGRLLEALGDAVAAVDRSGRVSVFNPAAEALFGMTARSVLGLPATGSGFPLAGPLVRALETGRPGFSAREEIGAGAGRRVVSWRTSVVRGPRGTEAALLVAADVTERERLEDALRRQEKFRAMGEMAASVAHEIRNPVNAIGMIAQRFGREFRPASGEAEFLALSRAVVDEVRRVDGIVQRFLDLARMPRPVLRPENLRVVLEETAAAFGSSAMARGVRFDAGPFADASVQADPDALKQALLNLLVNALDAVGPGGSVSLSARPEEGALLVLVADTGKGMAPEVRAQAFNPYFTTKPEGTGMGLPIAYQIVRGHGGDIEAESEPGAGTVMRVRLPAGGGA